MVETGLVERKGQRLEVVRVAGRCIKYYGLVAVIFYLKSRQRLHLKRSAKSRYDVCDYLRGAPLHTSCWFEVPVAFPFIPHTNDSSFVQDIIGVASAGVQQSRNDMAAEIGRVSQSPRVAAVIHLHDLHHGKRGIGRGGITIQIRHEVVTGEKWMEERTACPAFRFVAF